MDASRTADASVERIGQALLLAPLVFVVHFLEESPRFVPWFNAHVSRGITQDLFWTVNLTALVVTVLAAAAGRWAPSRGSLLLVVGWLSFLMLTNAVFHVTGTIADRAYVPGLVTALVLYLPYCAWLAVRIVRSGRLSTREIAAAAVLGGLPMAVHGYRILFLSSRLF
jgi:hypothetical protein